MTLKEYMEKLGTNDIEAALGILAKEIASMKFPTAGSHKVAVKIVKSLNKKEQNIYLEKLSEALLDNQEAIKIHMQFYHICSFLKMDPDEIESEQKNPFAKKLLLRLGLILITFVLFIVLVILKKELNIESSIYNIIIVLFSSLALSALSAISAYDILSAFRFRKAKKLLPKIVKIPEAEEDSEIPAPAIDTPASLIARTDTAEVTDKDSDDREVITLPYLLSELDKIYHNNRQGILIVGCIITFMCILFAFLTPATLILLPGAVVSGAATAILYNISNRRIKKYKKLRFYFTEDVCSDKQVRDGDNQSIPAFHLEFRKYGKHRINKGHTGIFFQESNEREAFESINYGEEAYLLMLQKDSKIHIFFPKSKYKLDPSAFSLSNGVYTPNTDKSYETIMLETQKEALENLTGKQKYNYYEFFNKSAVTEKKIKTTLICTIIGIAITLASLAFSPLAALGIFLDPFLYFIPLIIAIIACKKSNKAYHDMGGILPDIAHINEKQNRNVLSLLGLGTLQIFAYLANFIFIIVFFTP